MLQKIRDAYKEDRKNFNNKTIKDIQEEYNNNNSYKDIYRLLGYLAMPTINCWDFNEEGSYPEHWYDDPVEDRCPNDNECKPEYNYGLLDTEYYECAQEKCSGELEFCESKTECLNMLENCNINNNLFFAPTTDPPSVSSCFTDYGQVGDTLSGGSDLFLCTNQGDNCQYLMNNT